MKCFFNVSNQNKDYYEMAKAMVNSAIQNTDLQLFCIYNGRDNKFRSWLKKNSVRILSWELTFWHDIIDRYNGSMPLSFCKGTYLCVELPKVLKSYNIFDEFILYVDIDIIFNDDVNLRQIRPSLFASPPDWDKNDWSRFSTGVMVMNPTNLLANYSQLLEHLKKHNYNFEFAGMGPCVQGAWNTFYTRNFEKLSPVYDWKPWWGINPKAKIIHFSGPKPRKIESLLQCEDPSTLSERDYHYRMVIETDSKAYRHYLSKWQYYGLD